MKTVLLVYHQEGSTLLLRALASAKAVGFTHAIVGVTNAKNAAGLYDVVRFSALAGKIPAVHFIEVSNKSLLRNRWELLSEARDSDWVLFLDPDDVLLRPAVMLLKTADEDPTLFSVWGDVLEDGGELWSDRRPPDLPDHFGEVQPSIAASMPVSSTGSILFRPSLFERVAEVPDLWGGEDWYLGTLIALQGRSKFVRVPVMEYVRSGTAGKVSTNPIPHVAKLLSENGYGSAYVLRDGELVTFPLEQWVEEQTL